MDASAINALAEQIFSAIEGGDVDTISELWHDDIEVWHNTDGLTQTKAENLAVMRWMARNVAVTRYVDVRRHVTEHGFAQQHTLSMEFNDGRSATLHAALFVQCTEGKVRRLDEYIDSAAVSAAFRPA